MIYECVCDDCGQAIEYSRPVDRRNELPACPTCGSQHTRRVIMSAPHGFVTGKFEPYKSQVDGTVIRNKRDLEEHNRRNNVVLLGDGYSEEAIRAGQLGQKPVAPDKKEIAKEVFEAVKAVEAGYKPTVQVQDNE